MVGTLLAALIAANGMRLLRVFPNWADFQPIVAVPLNGGNLDVRLREVWRTGNFDTIPSRGR